MHALSFEFGDRYVTFKGYNVAFRVYTLYNVYTPHPSHMKLVSSGGALTVEADAFAWAGLQRKEEGHFKAKLISTPDGFEVEVEASHKEPIKATGVLLRGLEGGLISGTDWGFEEVKGIVTYSYPHPWLSLTKYLTSPLIFIRHEDGSYTYALSSDTEVRPKRFRVDARGGSLHLGLFHEEDARMLRKEIRTPSWSIGRTRRPEGVVSKRMEAIERAWGLKAWEEREDVPEWAREICLVLNLHFKHWTGFVFNTYERAENVLRWVSERIEGKRVLVYMTSWDGRYYYDYPRLHPDPDLGGEAGFKRLIDLAHSLGMHVIPMTSAVAVGFTHAEEYGFEEAVVTDKYGNRLAENWVDWDEDGERDNIWYPINLGHPKVRRHFLDRIAELVEEYGIDGIFLDISCFYENDPKYSFYEGLRSLVKELTSRYKGRFLVMGECWYDALLPLIPLTHAHLLLPRNWSHFYLRYARMAYHLSWPAPGGSTGVHEAGFQKFELPKVDSPIIPTLSIVHDTLEKYGKEAEEVIKVATEWGKKWGVIK